jgi:hypothetical protein
MQEEAKKELTFYYAVFGIAMRHRKNEFGGKFLAFGASGWIRHVGVQRISLVLGGESVPSLQSLESNATLVAIQADFATCTKCINYLRKEFPHNSQCLQCNDNSPKFRRFTIHMTDIELASEGSGGESHDANTAASWLSDRGENIFDTATRVFEGQMEDPNVAGAMGVLSYFHSTATSAINNLSWLRGGSS